MTIAVSSEPKPTNQDNPLPPDTYALNCNRLLAEIPRMKSPLIPESSEVEPVAPSPVNVDDIPLPKKPFTFDPETKLQDKDIDRAQKQGCEPETVSVQEPTETEPGCDVDHAYVPESSRPSEFQDDYGECNKSPPQKRGNKPRSKSKKQKPKAMVEEIDTHTPVNLDDIPLPKTSYNFDPSQWDDPSFDPFGGKNKVGNSPAPPEASCDLNPENFDDSLDAFKPSNRTVGTSDSERNNNEDTMDREDRECPVGEEKKVRQAAKKSKDKIIT